MRFTGEQLKEEFYAFLDGNGPKIPFSTMQPVLAEMDDELSEPHCDALGLPSGSTVGHAARSLIVVLVDGVEHLLDQVIEYQNEQESHDWWIANRNNPKRVMLTHLPSGQWRLAIAPISGRQSR